MGVMDLSYILKEGSRRKMVPEDYLRHLTMAKFPEDKAKFLQSLILKMRKKQEATLYKKIVGYPGFRELRWRLDVTWATSALKRVLRPSLLLCWTLEDGRIYNMECSIEKFSELRYNVALLLREMQTQHRNFNTKMQQSQKDKILALGKLMKLKKMNCLATGEKERKKNA